MNFDDVFQKASSNFKCHLEDNSYPGRGLVLGCDPNGDFLLLYWIMGRSENSRNRVFTLFDGGLRTEAADTSARRTPSRRVISQAVLTRVTRWGVMAVQIPAQTVWPAVPR